jgi:hypothetical protein
MPALVAGIHVFACMSTKTWMAGTSPAMTSYLNSIDQLDPADAAANFSATPFMQ